MKKIIIFNLLFCPLLSLSDNHFKASVGIGSGAPYGGIGIKVDYNLIENAYITAGLGMKSSIGFEYYLRDSDAIWRPKVSIYYGMVGYVGLNLKAGQP